MQTLLVYGRLFLRPVARRRSMTRFKLFSAALILSTGMATPVFAQAAISEPGAYAFYHPNGDVLHTGAVPAPDAYAMVPYGDGRVVVRRPMSRHDVSRYVSARRADRYSRW
jgi:hypothetical protein